MLISRRDFNILAALGGLGAASCNPLRSHVPSRRIKSLEDEVDVLIWDFDGTLTDGDKSNEPFVEGYKQDLANKLKMHLTELELYWQRGLRKILKNPSKHGWDINGRIIASALSDSVLLCQSILYQVLDEVGKFNSPKEKVALRGELFLGNYGKIKPIFKEGADDCLSEVWNLFGGRVYIITNSRTNSVKKKISTLPSNHSHIPIVGHAKKYILDNKWNKVPIGIRVKGLDRLVYLRRKLYGERLEGITKEKRTTLQRLAVVGNIWEMDLALPQYFGATIGLTPNLTTPQFEKNIVSQYRKGFVAWNLEQVYQNLKERVSSNINCANQTHFDLKAA